MRKIQFGSNDNKMDGWENLQEHDADITRRLPFQDNEIDYIFLEHVLEHISQNDAYNFLKEAHRILKPNGVIRIIVPDIRKIYELGNAGYLALLKASLPHWWNDANNYHKKIQFYNSDMDLMKDQKEKYEKDHDYQPTMKDAIETIIFCHGHKSMWSAELLITLLSITGFKSCVERYGESRHPELNNIDFHWKMIGLENCILESVVIEGIKI